MNEVDDPFRDWDAAYVLGALSSDDRRVFERHLATCSACTSAVGEVAGIPGILKKIDVNTATEIANRPSDESEIVQRFEPNLVQNLARSINDRKHRIRRMMTAGMAIAAAAVMVIGILIGSTIHPQTNLSTGSLPNSTTGTKVVMAELVPNAMTVDLQVKNKKWGTSFEWNCVYRNSSASTQTPEAYNLVVTDESGTVTTIATWSEIGSSAKGLTASTSIPLSKIRTVEIRAADTNEAIVRGEI